MTSPSRVMQPCAGSITAPRHLSRVVLPEPLGPMRPTTSPGATLMLTSLSASTAVAPSPYRLLRPSMWMPMSLFISTSNCRRRIDLARRASRQGAGEGATHHHDDKAAQRVSRFEQDISREKGPPDGGGNLAGGETA